MNQLQQFYQNGYRQCSEYTVLAKIDVLERCKLYDMSTLIGLQYFSTENWEYEHLYLALFSSYSQISL